MMTPIQTRLTSGLMCVWKLATLLVGLTIPMMTYRSSDKREMVATSVDGDSGEAL